MASRTVAPGIAASRSWARYAGETLWPKVIDPSSAGRSPAIVRRSVVLPAPFGPTIPIRSPRRAARNADRATVTGSAASEPSGARAPRPGR